MEIEKLPQANYKYACLRKLHVSKNIGWKYRALNNKDHLFSGHMETHSDIVVWLANIFHFCFSPNTPPPLMKKLRRFITHDSSILGCPFSKGDIFESKDSNNVAFPPGTFLFLVTNDFRVQQSLEKQHFLQLWAVSSPAAPLWTCFYMVQAEDGAGAAASFWSLCALDWKRQLWAPSRKPHRHQPFFCLLNKAPTL